MFNSGSLNVEQSKKMVSIIIYLPYRYTGLKEYRSQLQIPISNFRLFKFSFKFLKIENKTNS